MNIGIDLDDDLYSIVWKRHGVSGEELFVWSPHSYMSC